MSRRRRVDDPRDLLREALERVLLSVQAADDREKGQRLQGIKEEPIREACLTTLLRMTFLCFAAIREMADADESRADCPPFLDILHQLDRAIREDHVLAGRDQAEHLLNAQFSSYLGAEKTAFSATRFPFLQGGLDHLTLRFVLQAIFSWGPCGQRQTDDLVPAFENWRTTAAEEFGRIYESLLDLSVVRLEEPHIRVRLGFWETALVPLSALQFSSPTGKERSPTRVTAKRGEFQERPVRIAKRPRDQQFVDRLRNECAGDADLWARIEPLQQLIEDRPNLPGIIPAGRLSVCRGHERAAHGIHYTPRDFSAPLVRHSLEAVRASKSTELLRLKVCDPACGSGAFLMQACREIAGETRSLSLEQSSADERIVLQAVATSCVYGVDRDPLAVEIARLSLWLLAADQGLPLTMFNSQLRVGNVCPVEVPQSRESDSEEMPVDQPDDLPDDFAFDWSAAFPDVFTERGGFDLILSNPPFRNVINHPLTNHNHYGNRRSVRLLDGTADLSFHFLELAHQICRPAGVIGILLPRPYLNTRSATLLRQELLRNRPPLRIEIGEASSAFTEANVRLVAIVFGQSDRQQTVIRYQGRERTVEVRTDNWWTAITHNGGDENPSQHRALAREFEIAASMTTRMAYEIQSAISDDKDAPGLRLVTTGLINPHVCLWGKVRCRYLKRDYAFPLIDSSRVKNPKILRRLDEARRPKVLVAGVAGPDGRLEAWFDETGMTCGAVSTYTVTHPQDSVPELQKLSSYLNSPSVAERVFAELHASSMGCGLLTIRKSFLQSLPCPE